MANKRTRSPRIANVVVPLDCKLVSQYLARGVGGQRAVEFEQATAGGFVPFERDIEPSAYSCSDSFRRDYLLSVVLSKFDDEKSADFKRDKALEKFKLAEERCRQTNNRFRHFVGGSLTLGVTVEACLHTARQKIQRLLGPLDLDEIARGFGFGPGASTRLSKRQSDTWYKFQGKPETTPNNTAFAYAVFLHSPLWQREVLLESDGSPMPFTVIRGNRVTTVPKNAKTDRTIGIEPDLNLFVQKGFGSVIRRRLKKVGVDLNDQTTNQILAHEGSKDGSLATIDLSMASDTVSCAIVEQLLPPDWLHALEQCRSQEGVLPCGEIIRYHKFSSMGNGFTFELESLIFWALCSAVADLTGEMDHRVTVYGDDIIVPTGIAEPVIGLLKYCGFETNREKSFWTGPFRESCGKHYFLGDDVTPFYIRSMPRRLSDVFLLHNNVVRWSLIRDTYRASGLNSGLYDLCQYVRGQVPQEWYKPRIPLGYGDGAFVGSFDECTPVRAPRGMCGWRAKVLNEPRIPSNRGGSGRLLKSLWGLESRPEPLQWAVLEQYQIARGLVPFKRGRSGRSGDVLGGNWGTFPNLLRYSRPGAPTDAYDSHLPNGAGESLVPFRNRSGDQHRWGVHVDFLAMRSPASSSRKLSRLLAFGESRNEVPMTARAKIVKIFVQQWADLGPWV